MIDAWKTDWNLDPPEETESICEEDTHEPVLIRLRSRCVIKCRRCGEELGADDE